MFSVEIVSLEPLHWWFEGVLGFRDLRSGKSGVSFSLGSWRLWELRGDCNSDPRRKTNAGEGAVWKECRRVSKIMVTSISR